MFCVCLFVRVCLVVCVLDMFRVFVNLVCYMCVCLFVGLCVFVCLFVVVSFSVYDLYKFLFLFL